MTTGQLLLVSLSMVHGPSSGGFSVAAEDRIQIANRVPEALSLKILSDV